MPTVTFLPAGLSAEFDQDKPPSGEHGKPGSLLAVALAFRVPLEHVCGGNCACTTCHVVVREGEANLSPVEDCEADRLEMAADPTLHSRLACQAVVLGDVTVEIPGWKRNYI